MPYLPEVNISDYTDVAAAHRAMRQKNLLQRAVQSNLGPTGQLNELGFYKDAARYGLDPEAIGTAMQLNAAQQDEAVKSLQRQQMAGALGGDLRAGERNQAPYGAPQPVTVPNPDYVDPTAQDWMRDVPASSATSAPQTAPTFARSDKVRNYFLGMGLGRPARQSEQTTPPPTTPPDSAFAPMPSEAERQQALQENVPLASVDGVYTGAPHASVMQDVNTDEYKPTIQIPGPDTRSFTQQVADSYTPEKSSLSLSAVSGEGAQPEESLFDWTPKNTGTNEYTQYETALKAQMDSLGQPSASAYLKSIYDQTKQSNTPRAPNPGLLMQGAEGIAKYNGELQDYKAGQAKAEGLARAAVTAEKAKLAEFAKQYGVSVVDTRKTELDERYTLRDPAKRTEAQALMTNKDNIKYAQDAVKTAGTNTSKLMLAFPQVARAYATALNPGMQLNEGNLKEVAANMFPESLGNKELLAKMVAGLARGFVKNDWSMFQQFSDALEAQAPGALAERMNKLAQEAEHLNAKSLRGYVTAREVKNEPDVSTSPTSQSTAPTSIDKLAGLLGIKKQSDVDPRMMAAYSDTTQDPEALMDMRAQLAQRLGLPKFNAAESKMLGYTNAASPVATKPARKSVTRQDTGKRTTTTRASTLPDWMR